VPQTQLSLDSENLSATLRKSNLGPEIFSSVPVHDLSGQSQSQRNFSKPQIVLEPPSARILVPPLVSSPGPIGAGSRASTADYFSHRSSHVPGASSTQVTVIPSPQSLHNSNCIPNTIFDDLRNSPTDPDSSATLVPQPSAPQSITDNSHGASTTSHVRVPIRSASVATLSLDQREYEEFQAFLEWRRLRNSFFMIFQCV
jgi:hypothetical protein